MKDKAVEKTELIINALDYAHKHDLDINKREDVQKILEAVNPEHMSEEEIEEFIKLLQDADTFMEITAKKKMPKEEKLPN